MRGEGWTSVGGLAPPLDTPLLPHLGWPSCRTLDHPGCSPCLPPAAPRALAVFPKEKKPPFHRRPHTGPESGGAEAALNFREMDHELVTFWVAANTSSIPGWPVSGFSSARLPSEQEGHGCSQRQVSLPRAHGNSAPHIPREPQRLAAPGTPALDIPADSGRAGMHPAPGQKIWACRGEGPNQGEHGGAEPPSLVGFVTLGTSLAVSGPQFSHGSKGNHHSAYLYHWADHQNEFHNKQ